MSEPVLADAQFGIVRILRPYQDFEDQYEGKAATQKPIMLSEGGKAIDALAEKGSAGYDGRLVRGLKVPVGARLLMWIPNIAATPGIPDAYPYIYTLMWRFRNVFDFQQARLPFHYPKGNEGVPETLVNPGARVVIPAASQSVIYNQVEGSSGPTLSFAAQNLHTEQIAIGGLPLDNPINPDGVDGAMQQGVLASSGTGGHLVPAFSVHEVQAVGDELLIGVTRSDLGGAVANWSFVPAAADVAFSQFYGKGSAAGPFPDLGVYVLVGTAP